MLYGYSEHLPGGNYPASFIFIEVDPQLVDFNIHPAKREVRFRNLQEIHRGVVDLIRSSLAEFKVQPSIETADRYGQNTLVGESSPHFGHTPGKFSGRGIDIRDVRDRLGEDSREAVYSEYPRSDESVMPGLRFHGQIFGLFLLAEYKDKLYIIDQHAAHERIIYEKLTEKPPEIQRLLVPIHLEVNKDEETVLQRELETYTHLGFDIEEEGPGSWLIKACPSECLEIRSDLADFIKGRKGDSTSLKQELYATVACRAAIMDGEIVDSLTGLELAAKALNLDNARCPHGRPIWHEVSREKLFELVMRT